MGLSPSKPTILPAFCGISIEESNPGIVLNVQDNVGNRISQATLTVTCSGTTNTAQTDHNGCVTLIMSPNEICDVTIDAAFYRTYAGRVELLAEVLLENMNSNFVVRVVNSSNTGIVGAAIIVNGTSVGVTNLEGLFEGEIDTTGLTEIKITEGGDQIVRAFNGFLPFDCEATGFRAIPVITI